MLESASRKRVAVQDMWTALCVRLTISSPVGQQEQLIEKPYARIGSDKSCEVTLAGIPAKSFYLHACQRGIYCAALEPTYWGIPLFTGWLPERKTVPLGDYLISAELVHPKDSENSPPHPEGLARRDSQPAKAATRGLALDGPPLRLCTVDGGKQAVDLRLRRPITLVGRQPPAKLCLADPSISRAHCILYWDDGDLWVIDLLSGNGTLIDGQPIDVGRLQAGSRLQLGNIVVEHLNAEAKALDDGGTDLGTLPVRSLGNSPTATEAPRDDLGRQNELSADARMHVAERDSSRADASDGLAQPNRESTVESALATDPQRSTTAEARYEQLEAELLAAKEGLSADRHSHAAQLESLQRSLAEQETFWRDRCEGLEQKIQALEGELQLALNRVPANRAVDEAIAEQPAQVESAVVPGERVSASIAIDDRGLADALELESSWSRLLPVPIATESRLDLSESATGGSPSPEQAGGGGERTSEPVDEAVPATRPTVDARPGIEASLPTPSGVEPTTYRPAKEIPPPSPVARKATEWFPPVGAPRRGVFASLSETSSRRKETSPRSTKPNGAESHPTHSERPLEDAAPIGADASTFSRANDPHASEDQAVDMLLEAQGRQLRRSRRRVAIILVGTIGLIVAAGLAAAWFGPNVMKALAP